MADLNRPRVFVVQEGPHDFGPAREYGDIDFLLSGEITSAPVNVSPRNAELLERMQAKLTDYVPDYDFILLAGSPVAIAWVCFALEKRHPRASHRFLKWDGQGRCYLPYAIGQKLVA